MKKIILIAILAVGTIFLSGCAAVEAVDCVTSIVPCTLFACQVTC